jgi:hypothetical protein
MRGRGRGSGFAWAALAASVLSTGPCARADDDPAPSVPTVIGSPFQIAPPAPGEGRVAASVFVGYRGSEGQTTGAIATVSPWGPAFLRLGAEATPTSKDGTARFLWGAGLESPRDGTFFVDLHDWGPVSLDRPFTLRDSELAAGYKVPRLCGGPFCIAPAAMALLPISGRLYGGGQATLVVAGTWFASFGLARTIPGVLDGIARGPAGWRLLYGLGRTDWRPGSLFVTYTDAFDVVSLHDLSQVTYPGNRQAHGVLVAGLNWAY